jgi:hypothetical protein
MGDAAASYLLLPLHHVPVRKPQGLPTSPSRTPLMLPRSSLPSLLPAAGASASGRWRLCSVPAFPDCPPPTPTYPPTSATCTMSSSFSSPTTTASSPCIVLGGGRGETGRGGDLPACRKIKSTQAAPMTSYSAALAQSSGYRGGVGFSGTPIQSMLSS